MKLDWVAGNCAGLNLACTSENDEERFDNSHEGEDRFGEGKNRYSGIHPLFKIPIERSNESRNDEYQRLKRILRILSELRKILYLRNITYITRLDEFTLTFEEREMWDCKLDDWWEGWSAVLNVSRDRVLGYITSLQYVNTRELENSGGGETGCKEEEGRKSGIEVNKRLDGRKIGWIQVDKKDLVSKEYWWIWGLIDDVLGEELGLSDEDRGEDAFLEERSGLVALREDIRKFGNRDRIWLTLFCRFSD